MNIKQDMIESKISTMERFERLYTLLEQLVVVVDELERRVQRLEYIEELD